MEAPVSLPNSSMWRNHVPKPGVLQDHEKAQFFEKAQKSFLNSRINLLEELLEDLQMPLDYHADDNDFEKMAKIKEMMQQIEDELTAARNGWDCHSQWLKKWKENQCA